MDLSQAVSGFIKQAHEQGGRPVGSPRVPSDVTEFATVHSIWYGPDACYCRLLRQGQTTPTVLVPWRGKTAPTTVAPGNRVLLTKPLGSINLAWCSPGTT